MRRNPVGQRLHGLQPELPQKMVISALGPKGSHSDQAAGHLMAIVNSAEDTGKLARIAWIMRYLGDNLTDVGIKTALPILDRYLNILKDLNQKAQESQERTTLLLPADHQAVIESLRQPDVYCAIIPVENTTTGPVPREVTDGLRQVDFEIMAALKLPIAHYLMAKDPQLLDPPNYWQIRTILVHKAVEGQCSRILGAIQTAVRNNGGVLSIEYVKSTAQGAEMLAKTPPEEAVGIVTLASQEAAINNGLYHTPKPIQDLGDNATTFLIVTRRPSTVTDMQLRLIMRQSLGIPWREADPQDSVNFIIRLSIANNIGSLLTLLNKLGAISDLNMNYIQVECNQDASSARPYISGTVSRQYLPSLQQILDNLNRGSAVELAITYTTIDLANPVIIPYASSGPIDRDSRDEQPQSLYSNLQIVPNAFKSNLVDITATIAHRPGALAALLAELNRIRINLTYLKVMAYGSQTSAEVSARGHLT